MNLSERLIYLRKKKHLTQKEVAAAINMSEPGYQRYENGRGVPTYTNLLTMARFFNVSLEYLVGHTDISQKSINNSRELLHERMVLLRKMRHLTQKDVFTAIKMSESGYQRYENNRGKPTYETLLCLAQFFDVSLDYLVGWSDIYKAQENQQDKKSVEHKALLKTQIKRIVDKLEVSDPQTVLELENYLNYLNDKKEKQSKLTAESK